MTKAYSYLRFSTPEQSKGDSTRRQRSAAEHYAVAHGLDLQDVSYEDLGISAYRGSNLETGRLGEFLEAVRFGAIERGSYLLVESLDRISRHKPRKAVRVLEEICEAGIVLVTLADRKVYTEADLDDGGMTFMWAFMVAMRAHEESVQKGKRVRAAWAAKRAKASTTPLTRRTPAWLTLNADRLGFSVIEERADVIRGIFAMTLEGVGKESIAKNLNLEGVPVFGDGSRKGLHWHRSYVAKLLENPAVVGTLVPHETYFDETTKRKKRQPLPPVPNHFPSIVDQEVFDRVQAMFKARASARGRHAGNAVQSIVAGLARCPLCDSSMTRKVPGKGHGRPLLVCARAKTGAGCEYRSVPLSDVEETLVDRRVELLTKMPAEGRAEELADEIDAVEGQITGLEEILETLLDQLTIHPSPAIRERIRITESDLAIARARCEALVAEKVNAYGPLLERKMEALVAALAAEPLDRSTANVKLRELCGEVVVDWTWGILRLRWHHGGETELQYGWPDEEWNERAKAAE